METESPFDAPGKQSYVRTIAFVVMALCVPLLGYFINESSYEKATLEADHYQEERAQITLSKIRAFLLNATQLSETLRVLTEQYYGDDITVIETYLDRIVESAPEDLIYGAGVWYEPKRFDSKKQFVGPYVHRGLRPGTRVLTKEWETDAYNFHDQDWYLAALEGLGHATFTEPYFDNGQVYMTLAISFNDRKSGRIRGVVSIDMILPQLQKLIDTVNENSSDIISVIGRSGRLLAHPRSFQLVQDARDDDDTKSIRSVLDVPRKFYEKSTWLSLTHESKMKENGWRVLVTSPKTAVMAGYLSQRTLIIALIIFFEVGLLIIYLLMGFFDEGYSRLKERSFQAVMVERNQMRAIVDNVQFGLFRADSRGRIQPGYSQSCRDILSLDSQTELTRRVFWHYFGLSAREEENFEAFYEQVFDLPFLANEMVDQIPSQITVRGKILSCRYYPILKGDVIESVLISFADVSRSRHTSRENEENKTLLRILRNKSRFTLLVSEILTSDDAILTTHAWPSVDEALALRKIRRLIHTWKGDLATFGLEEAAGYIHTMEDNLRSSMTVSQSQDLMKMLKALIFSYLQNNNSLLRINPSALTERSISVPESTFSKLQGEVSAAATNADLRNKVQHFIDQSSMDKADETLSYLALAAQDLARRQDKQLRVETQGGSVALPHEFQNVLNGLIHLVRNAVDHGVEKPKERLGKPTQAHIFMSVAEHPHSYTIDIEDDGRGIDREKVKQIVLAKKLLDESAWDKLGSEEQLYYIFEDNVTTRDTISQVSGRGVGLDHLRAAVEDLQGTITIVSHVGKGTKFLITLPKPGLNQVA